MPIRYPSFVPLTFTREPGKSKTTRTSESDTDISPIDALHSLTSVLFHLFNSPNPTDQALAHVIRTLAKYAQSGIAADEDIEVLLAVSIALAKKA